MLREQSAKGLTVHTTGCGKRRKKSGCDSQALDMWTWINQGGGQRRTLEDPEGQQWLPFPQALSVPTPQAVNSRKCLGLSRSAPLSSTKLRSRDPAAAIFPPPPRGPTGQGRVAPLSSLPGVWRGASGTAGLGSCGSGRTLRG